MYYKKIEFLNGDFIMQYTNIPNEIWGWTKDIYGDTYYTKYTKNRPCEIWTTGGAYYIFDKYLVSDIESELEFYQQEQRELKEFIHHNGIRYRAVNSKKLKELKKEISELINITLQRLEIAKKYHNEMIIERRIWKN